MESAEFINKHKNKIINIVVVIVALIISNNIYKRQASGMESLIQKKDMEIKNNSIIDNINQLEQRLNAYRKLLVKKDAGLVINAISDIAKQSGVKIISIRPDTEQNFSSYIRAPFTLMLTVANYHSLGKFISKLENSQDVFIVEGIDMRSDTQTAELMVNLRLTNVAFVD